LAQAELQAGDRVAAENYYQHAEHYSECPQIEKRHSERSPSASSRSSSVQGKGGKMQPAVPSRKVAGGHDRQGARP
jgi:hypothetical protein